MQAALAAGKEQTMRTMQVTGTGRLTLCPDVTVITLTLEGASPDYDTAVRKSAADAAALTAALEPLGFAADALKTQDFRIETEYESYETKGVWRQRFVGYRFHRTMQLEFPSDGELLGRLLFALAHSAAEPEIRIGYRVGKPEQAKQALLEAAVADAKEKAAVLAKAADVRLKFIRQIRYGQNDNRFEAPQMQRMLLAKATGAAADGADSYDPGITPEAVTAEETVDLLWEID